MSEDTASKSNDQIYKGSQQRKRLNWKIKIVIIFAIVVVLLGSLFTFNYAFAESCDNRENRLYSEIANVLKHENHQEMVKLVEKIKAKENYEGDPHCAYALIAFDLMNEEADAAELKYGSFVDNHAQADFSPSFADLGIEDFIDARGEIDRRLSDIRGFFTTTF